jgi:hypothetical protein
MYRAIGQCHVFRAGIGIRENGDAVDSHCPRRLDDATGDFAPVRYQNAIKHISPPRS